MEKLKHKILKEGKAIGTQIIKVDGFVNHRIDVKFMEELGAALAQRFAGEKVDKILTVESSGIAIACLTAPHFGYPPVVFAKKSVPNTLSEEFYHSEAKSFTKGTTSHIVVSRSFLSPGDRVLILDDFLAHGQASLALDPVARLRVVRKMYELRFGASCNPNHSVEQLRGVEGARVKALYGQLAKKCGVHWTGRRYDPKNASAADTTNRCLSSATACLYGVSEAAILAAGYSPAIGFIHTGKPRSFVFDLADVFKFETVIPVAFRIAGERPDDPEGEVRRACRDVFRQTKLLKRLVPAIDEMLSAGGLSMPEAPEDALGPAFKEEKGLGDVGHRG